MSSNTPGYPGGYSNYPPQPDQGYGAPPPPSYSRERPPSYSDNQPYGAATTRRPMMDPSSAAFYGTERDSGPGPAKTSRRGLMIGLIVAAVVVALLFGGAGLLYKQQADEAAKPVAVANAFCQDLQTQNYTAAYALLSSADRAKLTQADYTQASQLHDQLDGKVKDCTIQKSAAGFSLTLDNTAADLSAQIARTKTFTGGISLVKEGDNWKVNALDASLQGTDVGPLAVGQNFCSALAAKNYTAAYADFSAARQQAIGSQSDYANAMKANFGGNGVSITGCKMRLDTYSVASADDAASITMELDVKVSTSSGSQVQAVPLKITFTKNGDQWKIDDAEVAS